MPNVTSIIRAHNVCALAHNEHISTPIILTLLIVVIAAMRLRVELGSHLVEQFVQPPRRRRPLTRMAWVHGIRGLLLSLRAHAVTNVLNQVEELPDRHSER
jgi:hypothetical protein